MPINGARLVEPLTLVGRDADGGAVRAVLPGAWTGECFDPRPVLFRADGREVTIASVELRNGDGEAVVRWSLPHPVTLTPGDDGSTAVVVYEGDWSGEQIAAGEAGPRRSCERTRAWSWTSANRSRSCRRRWPRDRRR